MLSTSVVVSAASLVEFLADPSVEPVAAFIARVERRGRMVGIPRVRPARKKSRCRTAWVTTNSPIKAFICKAFIVANVSYASKKLRRGDVTNKGRQH